MKSKNWLAGIVDVLFPPACLSCGNLLETGPEEVFCPSCREGLVFLNGCLCPVCGLPFPDSPAFDHLCGSCIEKRPPFSCARSVFSYEGIILEEIRRFKYGGNLTVGSAMALMMSTFAFRNLRPGNYDLLIPVPLHPERLRRRGFNQALVLAGTLASVYEIAVNFSCLARIRPTQTQTGLDRDQRRTNVRGAFALRSAKDIEGKKILLVDDVLTTGATIGECARLLLKAGADDVAAVTLARVSDKAFI